MAEEAKVTEQKLTNEEVQKLETLQKQKQNITYDIGNLEVQQRLLNTRRDELDDSLENHLEEEKKFYNELREKYQNGTIDLDRKVFIPVN